MRILSIMLLVVITMIGCKKDDDLPAVPTPEPNEEEVITTLKMKFTDGGGNETTFMFQDADGDGGDAPTIDTITLLPDTSYTVEITLLNETESPAEDVTAEIEEEDDEHLFCFTPSQSNITITRTDSDGTYEVGLKSTWTAASAGTGTVQVSLKHQPEIKDGTCAPGETDIEVDFPIVIN